MVSVASAVDLAVVKTIGIVTVDAPPVNALSAGVRRELFRVLQTAFADPAVGAILLICAGRTYFAGADIAEFGKPPEEPSLLVLLDLIEHAGKPVVTAIHGTALGGGLETALVCHYRIAVASAQLGLPEVRLGLVPGAGGTQRLPRIVGAAMALDMVTSGRPISGEAGLAAGLVDALAPEGQLRETAFTFAKRVLAEGRPLRKVRDQEVKGVSPELFAGFRRANAKRFRGFEAPEANIRCIEAAAARPFEEGLAIERGWFEQLKQGPQSAAQRHAFFAERLAAKLPDLPPDLLKDMRTIPVNGVGVVGGGTMGGGIAMTFLSAGIPVTIVETAPEALDRCVGQIRATYERSAARHRLTREQADRAVGLLTPTLHLGRLADRDLVIEAVYENLALKKDLFARLDRIAKPGAILATNTSYLDVDEIAAATSRPASVLGLHFFSPAHIMRLLEVVRGARTAPAVLASAMAVARRIGKVAVVARVCRGFIGNRMLVRQRREAEALILEGALPWDVDRVVEDFGFPMGPFRTADLAGLDLGWSKQESTGGSLRDRLCDLERRGEKTSAGYYDYDANRTPTPSPVVEATILDQAARLGIARRPIGDREILERCLYPMINEGAKILEEGIASRASDIDVVWINGYGWPVYRGGPMFHADEVGVATVRDVLRGYETRHGADYAPAALLNRLADEGGRFGDR